MTGHSVTEIVIPEKPVLEMTAFDWAARFGARTRRYINEGRDPYETARLAASFVLEAWPALVEPIASDAHLGATEAV